MGAKSGVHRICKSITWTCQDTYFTLSHLMIVRYIPGGTPTGTEDELAVKWSLPPVKSHQIWKLFENTQTHLVYHLQQLPSDVCVDTRDYPAQMKRGPQPTASWRKATQSNLRVISYEFWLDRTKDIWAMKTPWKQGTETDAKEIVSSIVVLRVLAVSVETNERCEKDCTQVRY